MSSSIVHVPSSTDVRDWFPSITDDFAFLENAGGSQVPGVVAEAIRHYLLNSYVQVGAGYPQSLRATDVVADAHRFVETMMNAEAVGKVVLGPSTTALINVLASAYAPTLRPGDEIIIADSNHESNAGPWARLERLRAKIVWWGVDRDSTELRVEDLEPLLNERTKIVALPHVSNLLGDVIDVRRVTELVHRVGAKVVVDGVAYAPHRAIDVEACGADWYVYSTYKVYGPHMAAMFGRHEAFAELRGPNHFFIETVPYQYELGSLNHEGCAGLIALRPYLRFLAGREEDDRATVVAAYKAMHHLESPVAAKLLAYLRQKPDVRLIGLGDPRVSVGIVSFVTRRRSSPDVVAATDQAGIGIRYGHMYAYRLLQNLHIEPSTGVVRVSLAHYNTIEEIDRLIEVFEQVL